MGSMLVEPSHSRGRMTPVVEEDETAYDGWMNAFCDEPSGDVQTCCLAFWFPSILYGRINERITLVQDGKDPELAGNGCGGECLIWSVTGQGFCGKFEFTRCSSITPHTVFRVS